ncbi:hypothetical protein K458DRAFT_417597 [Lentithecium fluviatile CBS 122367]|uniref:Uncharacterized protein n=1 Tax=Lentithecium fluviatile CBS 122367 TaxID=1168545 RepID=A0A6G1J3L1_9PLEO|nr:hypothetical protein K458DRAFT_417597 [Lentithecium fluviatile CBS 122367]
MPTGISLRSFPQSVGFAAPLWGPSGVVTPFAAFAESGSSSGFVDTGVPGVVGCFTVAGFWLFLHIMGS